VNLHEADLRVLGLVEEKLHWLVAFLLPRKSAVSLALGEADPEVRLGRVPEKLRYMVFFFSRKEAKALVLLRRRFP
jgi:hypothetical protein